MVEHFWKPVGWLLDSSPLFHSTDQHHQIQLATYCLPYIRLPKMPSYYMFTLKMATAMFAKMLINSQHLTWLIPKSQSCTLNSSHENLRTRMWLKN
jgi:hypothetical protein